MSMSREVTSRTIASVLAGIILAAVWFFWASVEPIALGAWTWTWGTVSACFLWFFDRVHMQRWFFLLLLGVTLVVVVRKALGFVAWSRLPSEPTPADFTKFERFGMIWRWRWATGGPNGVTPFCPRCDRHIRYTEDRALFSPEPTEFFCSNCSGVRVSRPGKYGQTIDDVMIEIDHAVRSGEWKRHVALEESSN